MTPRPSALPSALAVFGLLTLGACSSPHDKACIPLQAPGAAKGTPVATFDGAALTVEELNERFAQMPPAMRVRYQTQEQKKQYVDRMSQMDLLAHEALRLGLQDDPEVVEAMKRMLAQRALQKSVEAMDKAPTPQEIAAFYEAHKGDYVKPATTRVFDLFLAAPKQDSAKVAAQTHKARELLKRAQALPPTDFIAFQSLVKESSEDPRTKAIGGNMNYLSHDELAAQYGAPVAQAADGLKNVGDVAGPVVTDQGLYILKLSQRTNPINLSLDVVTPQIKTRLQFDRRGQNTDRFLEELKRRVHFQVDEKALTQLKVDPGAPYKPPRGTPVGGSPVMAGPRIGGGP